MADTVSEPEGSTPPPPSLCDQIWSPIRSDSIRRSVSVDLEELAKPLHWDAPLRIFLSREPGVDLFDKPTIEEICTIFGVMAACPHHTFLLATEYPDFMMEWFEWLADSEEAEAMLWSARDCATQVDDARTSCIRERLREAVISVLPLSQRHDFDLRTGVDSAAPWPLPNVGIGTCAHTRERLDDVLPCLLATPATMRFLLSDPHEHIDARLTGCFHDGAGTTERPDELEDHTECAARIEWVIASTSLPSTSLPSNSAEARDTASRLRSLRDQCAHAGIPLWIERATLYGNTITAGPGSVRRPRDIVDLPYLDGVQHTAIPLWWFRTAVRNNQPPNAEAESDEIAR